MGRLQYETSTGNRGYFAFCWIRKPRRIYWMVYATLLVPGFVRRCGAPVPIPK